MKSRSHTNPDIALLHELVGGFALPGNAQAPSVGIVGSASIPPRPPEHCLHTCLGGDATAIAARGCPFLQAAARGDVEPGLLSPDGRCTQDFQVAALHSEVGTEPVVLVTTHGTVAAVPQPVPVLPENAASDDASGLQRHLDAAAQLVQRIGAILEENAGFADEVLRNYEQLNLIFDLTQQIAEVTEATAIEQLLLDRLSTLLNAEFLCALTPDADTRIRRASDSPAPPIPLDAPEVQAAITAARTERHAHIGAFADHQMIVGPLVKLDDVVDVVIATRPADADSFTSGDMMIVESVLSFGGQIISNSELHARLRETSMQIIRALVAAIDAKDHYTSGHSERGGFLTRLTATEMGFSSQEQQNMEWAGLLHDVGKIGVPEEILCKPGKLTPEEFEKIKAHPRMGYDILKPIASMGVVLDGVLYHHEYPDGSGYPEGLKGNEIPVVARIIHVVDTFDALTSTRSYRRAFSMAKARAIIEAEYGQRIDQPAAEAFFRAFERYRHEYPEDFATRFANLILEEPVSAEEPSCESR